MKSSSSAKSSSEVMIETDAQTARHEHFKLSGEESFNSWPALLLHKHFEHLLRSGRSFPAFCWHKNNILLGDEEGEPRLVDVIVDGGCRHRLTKTSLAYLAACK